mmetsp:Transcript_66089/g.175998  ORF Transcript_66089/g.175998 Transcript_66089/m.175998 type:complete len:145 (+) Transcript_66089:3-437(+)
MLQSQPRYALLGRAPVSAFYCLKGSSLVEMPTRGSAERYARHFRLLPETSALLIEGHSPQPLLGAAPSLSPWATQQLRDTGAKGAAGRGFRLILESSELNVIATSAAEREHWLTAISSLPFGAVYAGRVHAVRSTAGGGGKSPG